jgi:Tfp pilus assembly protein PilV
MNARARRRPPASEEGFALIEVVVSAAVLVMVVLGVLAGIDAVSHTAAANQSKTVAATLAEKDLERLRALRTADLNRLAEIEPETSTVKVGHITYTITSKAQLVTDSTGEDVSCSVPTGKGSYLRITSTVTSPMTGGAVKPVTMSSIVAPQPGQGTLTGFVRNAMGAPVQNLPVQAIGPSPDTQITNAAGCAVFDDSEAGSYTLRLNQSGWVDKDGNQLVEKPGTVSAGSVTTVEFQYDRAGRFSVAVVNSSGATDPSQGLMAAHTLVSTGFRQTAASPFTGMFPFPDQPYQVYSGTCTGNDPSDWIPGYFDAHPEAVAQVDPGATGLTRTVIEPSVNVLATYKNGTNPVANASGAIVYAYPRTEGCNDSRVTLGTTGSDGKVATPGLPFGEYDLCVQYTAKVGSTNKTWRAVWMGAAGAPALTNDDPAGATKDDAGNNLTAAFVSGNNSTPACGATTPIS